MSKPATTLDHATSSPAKAWLRALQLTASIPKQPRRILTNVVDELAEKIGDNPALVSDGQCLTYRALSQRAGEYGRWALRQGLRKRDVVCLLMPNCPEYMAIWLGITGVRGIVSLLNTHLTGSSLAHCINIAEPHHIVVSFDMLDPLMSAMPSVTAGPAVWVQVEGKDPIPQLNLAAARETTERGTECDCPSIEDTALYIYTSGTTGLPKAAKVSHFRLMQWSHWFSGMMDVQPSDRMYNCLPMYHSVGGVVATGAVLAGGGTVVIRDKFSASNFWTDIVHWRCTLFQYIGELCRYLLLAERSPYEDEHRIRMCCGNGLRSDIWNDFKNRFRIPHILEFYAATEGNFSLYNVEGKEGSIGRIPPFLAHRFPVALVKFDVQNQEPVRNEQGLCIPCSRNEVGEALGKIAGNSSQAAGRFEGYTSSEASELKIVRNVFEPGDAWFRTGDLMRKDDKGYFYFVDRTGDTFRWKGENVAASEVSEAICEFPGIREATVYGVTLPRWDGRACMAAVVTEGGDLDLIGLRSHLIQRLPAYAQPLFLRIRDGLEATATFKYTRARFMRDGYDPAKIRDPIFLNHPEKNAFVRIDDALFGEIQSGRIQP